MPNNLQSYGGQDGLFRTQLDVLIKAVDGVRQQGHATADAVSDLRMQSALTTQSIDALVERLDKLNGSVARHEAQLTDTALMQAKEQGRSEGFSSVAGRAGPIIYAAIFALIVILLQNAPSILHAIGK